MLSRQFLQARHRPWLKQDSTFLCSKGKRHYEKEWKILESWVSSRHIRKRAHSCWGFRRKSTRQKFCEFAFWFYHLPKSHILCGYCYFWIQLIRRWIHINVTESRVWLLTAQNPMKRLDWWKGKFALFWMLAAKSKGRFPLYLRQSADKSFNRWREGGCDMQKHHSQLWQSLRLVIHGLTSLIALSIVNLQFQGQFVPIFLRPVLRTVAADVTASLVFL